MSEPLPPRFAEYIATLRDGAGVSLRQYPGLRAQPWHDVQTLPAALELERAAAHISAEFRAIDPAEFAPEHEPIARRGAWDVVMLYERGRRHDDRFRRLPTLGAIVDGSRTVRHLAGLVYFSRLAPHTRVAAHTGPTNLRVRVHLGIDVPPGCGIRVGDTTSTWQTGKCLAFEDSFEHEVWNDSDRERIVLVVDLWHPDLSDDEVRLLAGFEGYIERTAEGLQRFWAANV